MMVTASIVDLALLFGVAQGAQPGPLCGAWSHSEVITLWCDIPLGNRRYCLLLIILKDSYIMDIANGPASVESFEEQSEVDYSSARSGSASPQPEADIDRKSGNKLKNEDRSGVEDKSKGEDESEVDAKLAERLSSLIESANERVVPLCKMIRKVSISFVSFSQSSTEFIARNC